MLTDAGSIPAVSTNSDTGLDHSRPVITNTNQLLSNSYLDHQLVSSGLNRSLLGHKYVTKEKQGVDKALELTNDIGTKECAIFRKKIFEKHQPLSISFAYHYLRIYSERDYRAANLALLDLEKRLEIKDLNFSASDAELIKFCEDKERYCKSFAYEHSKQKEYLFEQLRAHVVSFGLTPPTIDRYNSIDSCLNRMTSKTWWLRKIRKHRARVIESIARDLCLVNQAKTPYCSKWGYNLHREQVSRNAQLLDSMVAVNNQGDSYTLKELQDLSVSNPKIRRAELMTRIRGFETVAEHLGHVGGFFTITTPSKMHAAGVNGKRNPNYDGTTPRQANDYLVDVWSLIRSSLARKKIRIYGFRVVEPHHDETPHWHLLLFYRKQDEKTIKKTMHHYALAEDGDEPGASKHRFKVENIDPEKGSAAAYIAKYISKNIDGEGLDEDSYGNDAKRSSKSITAWASIWEIRQFQQIGGPSVRIYRELRRLETEEDGVLETARKAADEGDWAAYVLAMGGPTLPAKDRPIKAAMWVEETNECSTLLDVDTGELLPAYQTRYGNIPKGKIFGLIHQGKYILTRFFTWKIEHADRSASDDGEERTRELQAHIKSASEAHTAAASACHASALSLSR